MSPSAANRDRRALPRLGAFVAVVGLVAVVAAGWGYRKMARSGSTGEPLCCPVVCGPFVHEVAVRGEVESAVNVDVRCEVRPPTGDWLRILEVVPEGTHVEPGDFLVRLDSSLLESDLNQQKIACEQAKAVLNEAKNTHETAVFAEQEYLRGEFFLKRQKAEMALFVAEEQLRQARESAESARKLHALGFVTLQQMQADEFAQKAAETDVRSARGALEVLDQFTRPKKLKDLQSAVVTSQAKVVAAEYRNQLAQQRLADLEEQIRKCVLRAPVAGDVVLAHQYHNDHAHMVAPGEQTQEKRVLVRLPDPRHMQVKAKITEDKVAAVRPGLPATIELEAFPGVRLPGKVVRIKEFPDAEDWMGSAVKQYETTVRIEAPLPGLRPGLSAYLKIRLEGLEEQVQVPPHAVFRHGAKDYVIRAGGGRLEAQEVVLGSNNGHHVVVKSGLAAGDRIVSGAASYRDKVALPFVPKDPQRLQPSGKADSVAAR
jgi:RND family efflux transporter MFP subunit